MSTDPLAHRFALCRVDVGRWDIVDHSVTDASEHRVVAHIHEEEEVGVSVHWTLPVPLHSSYLTPEAALDDLSMWNTRREGWSRPVPIPHFPPPAAP